MHASCGSLVLDKPYENVFKRFNKNVFFKPNANQYVLRKPYKNIFKWLLKYVLFSHIQTKSKGLDLVIKTFCVCSETIEVNKNQLHAVPLSYFLHVLHKSMFEVQFRKKASYLDRNWNISLIFHFLHIMCRMKSHMM